MSQAEKATHLAALHRKGDPLVLYNIWDAGGAKALVEAGARAVATGSWSVAAAHGFDDGEAIPLDFALTLYTRLCASVAVPVTVDFEGGYATEPGAVAKNVRRVIQAGAVGINFEDRIVRGEGLYPVGDQVSRIAAIRTMASEVRVPLVINARTDLFLGSDPKTHADLVSEAKARAAAYAEAGADCFFIPGLTDAALITDIVESIPLPVNVMMMGPLATVSEVSAMGVSRISYGPSPFVTAIAGLKQSYENL